MNNWISIKDRLPDNQKDYQEYGTYDILAFHVYYISKKYLKDNYGDENYMEQGWYPSVSLDIPEEIIEITHWQPLPNPPEVKDE